jgi:hypothetical protein
LVGGAGTDTIDALQFSSANPGQDTVRAGRGNDTIQAQAGFNDVINCGAGTDTVEYDRGLGKVAADCEHKHPL